MAAHGEAIDLVLRQTLLQNRHLTPTILPWDRFTQWIHCICIVTFDLELGQAMEMIYPGHIKLTEKEKTNICYLAFPDSNSGCMGDTQFHFRIRQCPTRRIAVLAHEIYNKNCPIALQIDNSYFYGFVYFRQVKDRTVRRGYFQKSLVLLTHLPFINLFTEALNVIAPQFFENGEPSIEAACHDIDQWSAPTPGVTLILPLMGTVFQVRIPSSFDKLSTSPTTQSPLRQMAHNNPVILPSIHEIDIFRCFLPVLSHVQLLWELVITAEPVVVMATSPTVCSEMVQALISMIWPLRYCSDFRPFFTIHDSEFKEYTTKIQAPPPIIIGVTNPFFAKTLQHWPHIIRITDVYQATSTNTKQKIKKAGNLKTLDSKPGLYTRYKPFLQKEKTILKKLLKGLQTERPLEVQNALLRRYFLELTQSFMIPLERYMASLMPLQKNISPYKGTPTLGPFNPDDFLKLAEHSGPQLTTGIKGDWAGLYRRFFRCVNFGGWYDARYKEVSQKLQALHMEAMSDANLTQWIRDKQEVEIVDLVLRLRDKLATAENESLPLMSETVKKLQDHLENIIDTLPDDLKRVLKSS
ncbi:protein DENND6A [Centruroides vittatus]|uniref:protein DENND6A n=1 Tax=Centruroides vittatus TaxID=120091 RepID=UPI00350FE2F6